MTRSRVAWLLTVYFGVVLVGVAFPIDRYPLSWVPMYASYNPDSLPPREQRVKIKNKAVAARGFYATHRDGSTSRFQVVGLKPGAGTLPDPSSPGYAPRLE